MRVLGQRHDPRQSLLSNENQRTAIKLKLLSPRQVSGPDRNQKVSRLVELLVAPAPQADQRVVKTDTAQNADSDLCHEKRSNGTYAIEIIGILVIGGLAVLFVLLKSMIRL